MIYQFIMLYTRYIQVQLHHIPWTPSTSIIYRELPWTSHYIPSTCSISQLRCKCIMMGTNHLHAWTRTHHSNTCAISFDPFVRRCSLNLLLKCSSETTRLSAGRPSGAKQCSSRTQSRSLAAEYKNSCAFALHMAKTNEGSHLRRRNSRCLTVKMLWSAVKNPNATQFTVPV